MAHLVIIRGLPGAGKTTYARNSFKDYLLVEADDFFSFESYEHSSERGSIFKDHYVFNPKMLPEAHQMCKARVDMLIMAGKDVCVANTFTTKEEMRWYIECSIYHRAALSIYHVRTQFKSTHNVPQHTIDNMRAKWEPHGVELYVD